MKLSLKEAEFFNTVYSKFLIFVNKQLKVLKNLETPKDLLKINPYEQMKLRKLIYENMKDYINSFLEQGNLTDNEKELVSTWKHFIRSKFIVYRHIKNHSIFVEIENKPKIYGVLGLIDNMEKVMPTYTLPLVIEATLLPFRDKIIYDGMIGAADFNEPNMAMLVSGFIEEAKKSDKLITSLPEDTSVNHDSDWDGDETPYEPIADGETFIRKDEKVGRNDPCPCGSGKKYKKCCG